MKLRSVGYFLMITALLFLDLNLELCVFFVGCGAGRSWGEAGGNLAKAGQIRFTPNPDHDARGMLA